MFASTCTASARAAPGQHGARRGGGHRSPQLAPRQQLGVDRRDLRQHRGDLLAPRQPRPHRRHQARRHIPRPAPTSRFRREVGIRAVRLARRRSGSPACPQRRVCSTNDPASTCSTSPSRAASRRRRASSAARRRGRDRSFLCAFITQECDVSRHDNQQPRIARVTADSSARPSIDNRCARGGSPRSVHDRGTVIWPPTPPEHTNTASRAAALDEQHLQTLPVQRMERMRDDDKTQIVTGRPALCRLRRNPQPTQLARPRLGILRSRTG